MIVGAGLPFLAPGAVLTQNPPALTLPATLVSAQGPSVCPGRGAAPREAAEAVRGGSPSAERRQPAASEGGETQRHCERGELGPLGDKGA